MKADGTLLNFKQYAAFGETTLDTLGVTRQGYIGKEKDLENGLGDHGVRKYDPITGRFNSPDVLWEKYYGWSPYQYCMNNPIWAKDWDGRDIIVLLDKEGAGNAGHIAAFIGNENQGWVLFSKNGTFENGGIHGKSNYQSGEKEFSFDNLDAFYQDNRKMQQRYDLGFMIKTSEKQDNDMLMQGIKSVQSTYNLFIKNCADAVSDILEKGGLNGGKRFNLNQKILGHYIPNIRFEDIKAKNEGIIIDFNKERREKIRNEME